MVGDTLKCLVLPRLCSTWQPGHKCLILQLDTLLKYVPEETFGGQCGGSVLTCNLSALPRPDTVLVPPAVFIGSIAFSTV